MKPYSRKGLLRPREAEKALRPYLDFANLLDSSRELPTPYRVPPFGDGSSDDDIVGRQLFQELSRKARERFPVPPNVLSNIKRGRGRILGWLPDPEAPEAGWRLDVLSLYETFYAVRETGRRIVEALSQPPRRGDAWRVVISPKPRTLRIGRDGTVQQSSDLFEGFLGALERIDATRLKRCPVCANLYYAWRMDKGGCSERCCNILNVRKSRSTDKVQQYKYNKYKKAEAHSVHG